MTTEQIRKAQQCLRDSAFVCKKCEGETLPCSECRFGLNLLVADELEKMIPKKPYLVNIFAHYPDAMACPACNEIVRINANDLIYDRCGCGQRLDWSEE